MSRRVSILLVLAVLAGLLGFAIWKIFLAPSGLPPEGFARGNGRIEADLVDVSTRLAGRVAKVAVQEGDLVAEGDVLAVMDTAELEAQQARAQAAVASAQAAVAVAKAGVTKAEASLALAQSEQARAETLSERDVISRDSLDIRRTEAQLAEAGLIASKAEARAKERAVDAEIANQHEIEARIADSTLYAPVPGRVLYRLAQPGEVLGSGGKVVIESGLVLPARSTTASTVTLRRSLAGRFFFWGAFIAEPRFAMPQRYTDPWPRSSTDR